MSQPAKNCATGSATIRPIEEIAMKLSIRLCPKCGGTDLKNANLLSLLEIPLIIPLKAPNPEFYFCRRCNYYGPCLMVKKRDIKKFRKGIKPQKAEIPTRNVRIWVRSDLIIIVIYAILGIYTILTDNWLVTVIGVILIIMFSIAQWFYLFGRRSRKKYINRT